MGPMRLRVLFAVTGAAICTVACPLGKGSPPEPPLVADAAAQPAEPRPPSRIVLPPPLGLADRVRAYLAACAHGDVSEAESFLAAGARFWREEKTGPGQLIDRRSPAAEWDEELHASLTCRDLTTVGTAVGGICDESNDFYRLLGIQTMSVRLTTWFDGQDRIVEQFVEPLPDNPDFDTLLGPVLDWAEQHRPQDLVALFPDERLVRNRETAKRWRALLEAWRAGK